MRADPAAGRDRAVGVAVRIIKSEVPPMGQKRRIHPREFKLDALKLVAEVRPVAEASRRLGIHVNTLWGWRAQLASDPEAVFPGQSKQADKDEEIRRMKRELWRVTQERDILKKAAAYFANDEG